MIPVLNCQATRFNFLVPLSFPVIQNKYRSYCENKRFKQSLNTGCDSVLSSNLSTCEAMAKPESNSLVSKENIQNTSGLKRTYSQSTQNQAARKIQQFMLTAKNK